MSIFRSISLAVALLAGAVQAQFDFGSLDDPGVPYSVSITAQSDVASYQKGRSFLIAMKGVIAETWHAYFRNPGTVGMPISAELAAPAGFKVEGPFWEVPHYTEGMVGVSYSYDAPVLIWRVTPEESAPQQASFSVTGTIQACNDTGCGEPVTNTATLDLAEGGGEKRADWQGLESKVEVLGDTPTTVSASSTEREVVLTFSAEEAPETAYFFSDDNSINPAARQVLAPAGDGNYTLTMPRNDNSDVMYPVADESMLGKPLARVSGILTFGKHHVKVDVPTAGTAAAETPAGGDEVQESMAQPQDKAPAPQSVAGTFSTLTGTFISLFLGGLILNLMPCVFPVIGLKVMSFVELGGGSRSKVFLHSLAFVLGILISFWLLSLILIGLSNVELMAQSPWTQWLDIIIHDAGSETRNWAIWMSNPWVVYVIILLLLALGLSMYGMFEIGVGATAAGQGLQRKKGLWGSFFQGLLVTVVATPCSAPFLGASLPVALSLPGTWMLVAMTFMALGLAFPYIILGAFPALVNLLPRPGAWMESLKQGLSFLLFAAVAWLLVTYMEFISEDALMTVFISLVIICSAFWVYGRWCPIYRSKRCRIIAFIIALALMALGVWGSMPAESIQRQEAPSATGEYDVSYVVAEGEHPIWNEWSKDSMEDALEDGHPVYVDFTAKWCATCQSNKKVAYSADVYAEMSRAGVVLMRADKTRPNAAIDEAMRALGRSSVPTNALYVPGKDPVVTSELLTSGYLLDFLKENLPQED